MKRRSLLIGGGVLVAVSGAGVWRGYSQGIGRYGTGPAFAAWRGWKEQPQRGALGLVQAGILASNPHNTQPWLFAVAAERIEVYANPRRHLGAMDPFLREMHIGLGCALENMLLAAQTRGYTPQLSWEPSVALDQQQGREKPLHVATLKLASGAPAPLSLYKAIPHRHTDRAPYQTRSIAKQKRDELQRLAGSAKNVSLILLHRGEAKACEALAAASIRATKALISDREMARDSHRWFRHSREDIQTHRDGPNLDVAGLSPLMLAAAKMLPPLSQESTDKAWLDKTRTTMEEAPLLGMIAVRSLYDRVQAMEAGRLWQRLHLWATLQRLSVQPVNQLVEMVDRAKQGKTKAPWAGLLRDCVGDPRWTPSFVFRMGYPTQTAPPSPRLALKDVLLPGARG